ncbi:hypothetical protein NM208_g3042 [Fusarium decemcellulare]|uniref:Uncharacterized protein n=1 Tax=Fusarium decemcellulare TaxID=57161 RepID=A0ACC1SQD4_9HYPO|nr:hypothetical protein NM208_g3042 [Fusarium decemcellulare]
MEEPIDEKQTVAQTDIEQDEEFTRGEQRKIIHKVDRRLLIILGLMQAVSFLDRANMSNAAVAGMTRDLHLDVGNRYSIVLLVFFAPYVALQLPASILIRKVGPRLFLSGIVFSWGIVMMGEQCFGFVQNWKSLIALRFILGGLEAGCFPGQYYLISCWYSRFDLYKRTSIFYLLGVLGSASGGVLGLGFSEMKGLSGYNGWRWLFIMEGILTIFIGIAGFVFTVDFPDQAHKAWGFLTEQESAFIIRRINRDRQDAETASFSFRRFLRPALDAKVWGFALIFFCSTMQAYSVGFFLPIILKQKLGFTDAQAQGLSTPPYLTAMLLMFVQGLVSDKIRLRSPMLYLNASICITGLCLLVWGGPPGVQYLGAILVTAGCSANLPTVMVFQANNIRGNWKRAFCSASMIGFGGTGGIAGSLVFRSQDAPHYLPGIYACLTANGIILITSTILVLHFIRQNHLADQGKTVIEKLPGFRLISSPLHTARVSSTMVSLTLKRPSDTAGSAVPGILMGLFVGLGGFLYGYDTGVISGILGMPEWRRLFANGHINAEGQPAVSAGDESLIVSILSAGTLIGALAAAPCADYFGRKWGLIWSTAIVFNLGVALQTAATSQPLFIAGRFFAGFGVGLISAQVPLYQSETAPKWIRGVIVGAYQLTITLGLFVAAIVNNGTSEIRTTACYRIPVALQFAWAIILAGGLLMLPETPRFLVKKGDYEGALDSLSRLRKLPIDHPAIHEEIQEIRLTHEYELSQGAASYLDCFKGTIGKRLATGCGIQALQQLSGVNFIFYYGTSYFQRAGFDRPFIIQVITNSVNVVSTIPGLWFVDRFGRRPVVMIGAVGMSISQLIVATVGTVADATDAGAQRAAIAFVCTYIFFFASGWGIVAWVLTGELFPLKVRAKALSITTATNWLLNFAIAYSTPYLVDVDHANMQSKVFFIWGGCCVVSILFGWLMVYETKGLSLEEVDELYSTINKACCLIFDFSAAQQQRVMPSCTMRGYVASTLTKYQEHAGRNRGVHRQSYFKSRPIYCIFTEKESDNTEPPEDSVPPLYRALRRIRSWINNEVEIPSVPTAVPEEITWRDPWWEHLVATIDQKEDEILCFI